ncbi:TIGR03905 family TSCPD domain-containing protein [Succinimonas amylolytica]|uniref:TIGR03905 family TSCPD domain-containing protein n=1 Tax=Succinimonas amylolytica TaxID=83769 RepID=UPI00037CAC11|nr:TIGR03905 family TSCPD domain-containing protein [Succinimonas amylolytica]
MTHFDYETQGTCARVISFDMDSDHIVTNVRFAGGCDGNLKMISKFVEGMKAEDIVAKCSGNLCRNKGTSCADQLAKGISQALQG